MNSLRSKHKANLICGLIFLGLSIGVALYAPSIHVGSMNFGAMNARTFPLICAAAMALLSCCLIWQSIQGLKKAPAPTEEELAAEKADRKRLVHVLAAVVLVALYIFLLKSVGYLIVTPIFLFLLIMLITPKSVCRPIKFGIVSIAVSVVIYLIFRYAFSVQLPMGILG